MDFCGFDKVVKCFLLSGIEPSDESANVSVLAVDDAPGTSGLGGVGLTEEATSLLVTETVDDDQMRDNEDLTTNGADHVEATQPLSETAEEVCFLPD